MVLTVVVMKLGELPYTQCAAEDDCDAAIEVVWSHLFGADD